MAHKNKSGSYYVAHPIDFKILELLKPEGSMLGYHVLALPTGSVAKTLNKDMPKEHQVSASAVAGRMVSLHHAGFVSKQPLLASQGRFGWQRTPKGTAHYEASTGNDLSPREEPEPANGLKIIEGGQE